MTTDEVILVDAQDNAIGTMSKEDAHRIGALHRAFSILIFNSNGNMLLQRRALDKYHSGGLWTNACCSHPRPNESYINAAHRRLNEEIGLVADLNHVHEFVYKVAFGNGVTEHEYDHVFIGVSDAEPIADPSEVAEWKYVSLSELSDDIKEQPEIYTAWFKIMMNDMSRELMTHAPILQRA